MTAAPQGMPVPTTYERLLISRFLLPGVGGRLTLFIAAIGCAGVAIGVASLVLVVSFMNGAQARMAGQIASADGHLFVTNRAHALADPARLERRLGGVPGVATAMGSLDATGLVTGSGGSFGADLQGIEPRQMAARPLFDGHAAALLGTPPTRAGTMAIGSGLAGRLETGIGRSVAVTVVRDEGGNLSLDQYPFVVSALIASDLERVDNGRVIMPVDDLRAILKTGARASTIDITLRDPSREAEVSRRIRALLAPSFLLTIWRSMNVTLFQALQQEFVAMTMAISLVTVVALSNILSSMFMLVRHKAREIAILRTYGLSRRSTAKVFVVVGTITGIVGEAIGLGLGFDLKTAKDPVANALHGWLAHPPAELDVMLSLPLSISLAETLWILVAVLLGIVVSTLYPAFRAATIDPATVLRYT